MSETKIRLSPEEMRLVTNAEWILTKNEVIKKVKLLLDEVQEDQKQIIGSYQFLPDAIIDSGYKISKGENYLGLPYLILDHPRYFSKEDVFTVRTMFWWGRFFSITLHLSGQCKTEYLGAILSKINMLRQNEFYVCINDSQWEHHFDDTNYRSLQTLDEVEIHDILTKKSFLKIAQRLPITQWELVRGKMAEYYAMLMRVMQS